MSSLRKYLDDKRVREADYFPVRTILVPLKRPAKQWTVRTVSNMIPDSPVADAPEKIPYRLLEQLTVGMRPPGNFEHAFEGRFQSLKEPFHFRTKFGNPVPVAFHVLMAKAEGAGRVNPRTYRERTFLLLSTRDDGTLDEAFVDRLFDKFRQAPEGLLLAERCVLERLQKDPASGRRQAWDPGEYRTDTSASYTPVEPFVARAGQLFRRDVETLLDAELAPTDFFHTFTQALALHLGLLQPRLASQLNPAMELLERALDDPAAVGLDEVREAEAGARRGFEFEGRYAIRAPDLNDVRTVSRSTAARRAYLLMERDVTQLHFNLVVFNHVRALTEEFVRQAIPGIDNNALFAVTSRPSSVVDRMQVSPVFREYLDDGLSVLAVRCAHELLNDPDDALSEIAVAAKNGLDALRGVVERYNRQPPATPDKSRARKSGIQAINGLIGRGDYGLIQTRRGVGRYLQVSVGLIPLLLLLVIGARREKVRLDQLWDQLREYGVSFDPRERELLLRRLKSMGLYERFSDAGEANYVRNLVIAGAAR